MLVFNKNKRKINEFIKEIEEEILKRECRSKRSTD
jgi:hypothetical protein